MYLILSNTSFQSK